MSLDTYIMFKLKERTDELKEELIKKNRAPISLSMGAPTAAPPEFVINKLKENTLEPVMNFSKKMRAKGTFYFDAGEPSKVPEDSLWIVQQGWEIKNQYQR